MPSKMLEEESATRNSPVPHLEFKAALLLGLFVALVIGTALYLMYARGAFEATQRLVLVADDSEGVRVGMDLTFSGFPIGRVRRIELSAQGNARILVDVPRRDARWLRESSVFTLVRSLVGGAALKAYSGVLTDPPLPDGAERPVLIGDATAELPRLVSAARELLDNLTQMSSTDSALAGTLGNLQAMTERLKGPHGAAGVLFGNDADAQRLNVTLERVNTLLARLDGMAVKADAQVLGPDGVVQETRATIVQLNAMLVDARATLKKVDAVLAEAQGVAANARVATTDLGALRSEVDATVRKVERLVDEVNRKWPFARDAELELK
ncbi:MlaD family protein [Piscinibacter sp.]|uniref:MlaD family protein n=1 Tax=Piscinibacter sp. TaxID=1903157 RepID=UPI002CC2D25F|nr:MlaD family protein [Albitalea sp.]HUG21078.1 MlaD family protein [Albitalea sp.]